MSVTMRRLMLMACLMSPSFLWPSMSWALGLGEIHLNSALNEPMRAEIDLIASSPDELTALRAELCQPRGFYPLWHRSTALPVDPDLQGGQG